MNIKLTLNEREVEIVTQALRTWVDAPHGEAAQSAILKTMIGRVEEPLSREEWKLEAKADMDAARRLSAQREREATMLRAKLIQAEKDGEGVAA